MCAVVDCVVSLIQRERVLLRSRGRIHPRSFQPNGSQHRSCKLHPGPWLHYWQHWFGISLFTVPKRTDLESSRWGYPRRAEGCPRCSSSTSLRTDTCALDCHCSGAGEDGTFILLRTVLMSQPLFVAREVQASRFWSMPSCPMSISTPPSRRSLRHSLRKVRKTVLRSLWRYLLSEILPTRLYRWCLLRDLFPSLAIPCLPQSHTTKERSCRRRSTGTRGAYGGWQSEKDKEGKRRARASCWNHWRRVQYCVCRSEGGEVSSQDLWLPSTRDCQVTEVAGGGSW